MRFTDTLLRRWWRLLAVIIILFMAGPEIFIYAEGMAIMEVLGGTLFVFMYVVGFKLFFRDLWEKFFNFENRYHFFLPSLSLIRESPGLLYYAIPRRTIFYLGSCLLTLLLLYGLMMA